MTTKEVGVEAKARKARVEKVPGRFTVRWARPVGQFLAHGVWHTTVDGTEYIPATGPLIVASNHTGFYDGPLLLAACPRGLHFLTKKELMTGPLGVVLRAAGQITVDRSNGRTALATALAVLNEGRAVGIFPEGVRGRGSVDSAKAGVAWLAVHSGATVVPAAILGTRRTGEPKGVIPGFRRHMHVSFGAPIPIPSGGASRRQDVADALDVIRVALHDHVQDAVARTGIELPDDDVSTDPDGPRRDPRHNDGRE